jgi:hypothetical protein
MLKRRSRFLTLGTILAAVVMAAPGRAIAHYGWNDPYYMYTESNCTGKADPINLFFYGAGDLAAEEVAAHTGWAISTEGHGMTVRDHGVCLPHNELTQLASDQWCHNDIIWGWLCDWYHIRIWPGFDSEIPLTSGVIEGLYAGAGAHQDHQIVCAGVAIHVASDFNGPRNLVRDQFADAGHYWYNFFRRHHDAVDRGTAWRGRNERCSLMGAHCVPDLRCHVSVGHTPRIHPYGTSEDSRLQRNRRGGKHGQGCGRWGLGVCSTAARRGKARAKTQDEDYAAS